MKKKLRLFFRFRAVEFYNLRHTECTSIFKILFVIVSKFFILWSYRLALESVSSPQPRLEEVSSMKRKESEDNDHSFSQAQNVKLVRKRKYNIYIHVYVYIFILGIIKASKIAKRVLDHYVLVRIHICGVYVYMRDQEGREYVIEVTLGPKEGAVHR